MTSRPRSSATSASTSAVASSGNATSTCTRACSPRSGISIPVMFPRCARITRVIACSVPGRSEHSRTIATTWVGSGTRPLAPGGDATGVEAEPVHPAEVPGVLDLHAAVHHDREPPGLGDLRRLGADDAELEPQGLRPDRDGLAGDAGHRVGPAEDIHDVDRERNVLQ